MTSFNWYCTVGDRARESFKASGTDPLDANDYPGSSDGTNGEDDESEDSKDDLAEKALEISGYVPLFLFGVGVIAAVFLLRKSQAGPD